jgi:hypothetical protein
MQKMKLALLGLLLLTLATAAWAAPVTPATPAAALPDGLFTPTPNLTATCTAADDRLHLLPLLRGQERLPVHDLLRQRSLPPVLQHLWRGVHQLGTFRGRS